MTMKGDDSKLPGITANGAIRDPRNVLNFYYLLWAFVIGRSRQHMRLAKLDVSECQQVGDPLLQSLAPYVDEILPKGPF